MNKKKLVTSVAGVALAVVLLAGSATFSYLKDSTSTIKNEFNTNQVTVELTEDGIDANNTKEYEIIPGTSASKNPTVTVDATVDSYVFVNVTDTTDGLVEYDIADGWIELATKDNTTTYYRAVAKDATETEFDVIKDKTVYYSADLENSDMLDSTGALKDGIELTFEAFAIQQGGFSGVAAAAIEAGVGTFESISTSSALVSALAAGEEAIVLSDDIAFAPTSSNAAIWISDDTVICGNGYTISTTSNYIFYTNTDDISITLEDLTLETPINGAYNSVLRVDGDDVDVTIANCDITADHYPLYIRGDGDTVTISDTSIKGYCAIYSQGSSQVITISGSELTGDSYYNYGSSNSFAVIVAEGDDIAVTVSDSTMSVLDPNNNLEYFYQTRGDGNSLTTTDTTFYQDGSEVDVTDMSILDEVGLSYYYDCGEVTVDINGEYTYDGSLPTGSSDSIENYRQYENN